LEVEYFKGDKAVFSNLWQTTVQLPFVVNLTIYIALVALALIGFFVIWRRGKSAGFVMRWTTQDILVLAIMGVLLEVYDNLIGDQFITPILKLLPYPDIIHDLAINDLPYMFLLMVGIALIRKPFVATAMVFLNFLLMQLLFPGDKSSVLWWLYGIYQGLLVDLYIVWRGPRIFEKGDGRALIDGLIMGAVRAVPAVTISAAIMGPLLNGDTTTFGDIFLNGTLNLIGNGLEAGLTAGLAIYVAHSVSRTSTHEVVTQEAEVHSEGSAS
jgi:hypothetical protein